MNIYHIEIDEIIARIDTIVELYDGIEETIPYQTEQEFLDLCRALDWYRNESYYSFS